MYASPQQVVHVLVCLPSAESTPSSHRISPASQTGAGGTPPHHPGPTAAGDAFTQKQSCGFYDVQTTHRKLRRRGQRTWPLPQGACGNHSRIFYVNKAHSSLIQVCSQHLCLISRDRAGRLSVILGFWALNDQGLRAAHWPPSFTRRTHRGLKKCERVDGHPAKPIPGDYPYSGMQMRLRAA